MKSFSLLLLLWIPLLSSAQSPALYRIECLIGKDQETHYVRPGEEVLLKSTDLPKRQRGILQAVLPEGVLINNVWTPLNQIKELKRIPRAAQQKLSGGLAFGLLGGMLLQGQINRDTQGETTSIYELATYFGLIIGGATYAVMGAMEIQSDRFTFRKKKGDLIQIVPWEIGPGQSSMKAGG